jgi:hypothetical protein
MHRILRITFTIIQLVCFTLFNGFIGGALGLGISYLRIEGYFIPWTNLGTPSEPPFRIIDASFDEVIVFAPSGQSFRFERDDNQYWAKGRITGQWVSTNTPRLDESVARCPEFPYHVAPPPGKIIDVREVGGSCWGGNLATKYAITDDGSVWQWKSADPLSSFALCTLVGILIGLIASPILFFGVKRGHKPVRHNQEQNA